MTNLEYITNYRKMRSVGDFCKIMGIDSSNLVRGKSTKENEEKIATLCKLEIIKMYNDIIQNNIIDINYIKNEVKEIAETNSL